MQYIKLSLQPFNISVISETEEKSKLSNSKNFNDSQLLNIIFILVTNDVLKVLRSNDINDLQLENISSVCSIKEVS